MSPEYLDVLNWQEDWCKIPVQSFIQYRLSMPSIGKVGCGKGVMYLKSSKRPTDVGLQLGKACYPCSR